MATIAKATLIDKGNAICRQANRERERLPVPAGGDPLKPKRGELDEWGAFLAKETEMLRDEIGAIERLGEPDEDGAVLNRAIANATRVVDLAEAASRSAADDDLSAYKRKLKRLFAAAGKASVATHRFGFRACG